MATTTLQKIIVIVSMVAGTAFLIWIGEMITEKGIGNGISLLIFIGIISKLPTTLINSVNLIRIGSLSLVKAIIFSIVILSLVKIFGLFSIQNLKHMAYKRIHSCFLH